MKRIICLTLVFLLIFSTLVSCGIVDTIPGANQDANINNPDNTPNGDQGGSNGTTDTPGNDDNQGNTPGDDNPGNDDNQGNTPGNNPGDDNPGNTDTPGDDNPGNTDNPGNNPGNNDGPNINQGNCLSKEMHVDSDSNGLCDNCTADVVITLDIYAINDLHGKVFDTDSQIGVDEMSTYLLGANNRDEQYILISSGDMWQGSAESNITKGLLVTDWMNYLGFVSMTLGNHEYDWGEDYIRQNAAVANFALLAINVYDKSTNKRAEYCQPSVIVERGDLKIGIIGAIGDCYSSISGDKVEGVYFKTGSELTELVKQESDRLRNVEGVDIVIYSVHDGYDSALSGEQSVNKLSAYYGAELSRGGYVDVVFEGHTHQKYSFYDTAGVYHFQNGGDNKNGISHIELDVNFANNKVKVNSAGIVTYDTYASMASDKIVDDLRVKYADLLEEAFGYLGYNAAYRKDSYIEQLTADLYYELGIETWGDKYDIVLGGGFLKTRSPYNLQKGDVTYSDLLTIMPFDNQIVLCSIKGSDLKKKFFETTNSDYYISYCSYGESVKNSINSNATYYVVVDMYTAQYAPNNLTVVEYYDDYTFARDLLAEYVKAGGLAK